ncbi:Cytokine receptor-like factor 3, partial [Homalodisca vitripennis]
VEDRGVDDHTYLLQLAAGFHPTPVPNRSAAVYRDVYRGPDTSCVVRDVRPGAPYTLRVCGCGEQGQWGAWSLPRLATTHQLAFRKWMYRPLSTFLYCITRAVLGLLSVALEIISEAIKNIKYRIKFGHEISP